MIKQHKVARIKTVAFRGLVFPLVEVQVQISPGPIGFSIVGLAQRAVVEAKERVRAALSCLGLAWPKGRITVNLAPADLPKEGNYYDLPIALALLAALELVPEELLAEYLVLGELELDGSLASVNGVLAVALLANRKQLRGIICPQQNGAEAAWIKGIEILAPASLLQLINHLSGKQSLTPPLAGKINSKRTSGDFRDVLGQESAKRALEIAAAGKHHVLFIGPPGVGKTMLANRFPSILPPLTATEALEVSVLKSLSNSVQDKQVTYERPFRCPHHTASAVAMIGGGKQARPGEISLSHHGVLFADELAEFNRAVLDGLRQPLEKGEVEIARANLHVTYPARFLFLAAMNPCRCGGAIDQRFLCARGPKCAQEYQARISGPLLDRIDIRLDLPAISPRQLAGLRPGEKSAAIRARVLAARSARQQRAEKLGLGKQELYTASLSGTKLETALQLLPAATNFLQRAGDKIGLSLRGYNRTLKLARTIADLEQSEVVTQAHLTEALAYRGAVLPAAER